MLLFVSTEDRTVFISTGSGIEKALSLKVIDSIISSMRPYLRDQKYGNAVECAVLQMVDVLSGFKRMKQFFLLMMLVGSLILIGKLEDNRRAKDQLTLKVYPI